MCKRWYKNGSDIDLLIIVVVLQIKVMTNGRFLSVRHRAMTNSHKSRMSVAYFGGPPLDACIVAPPVMVTPERPSLLFKPFTWAEYKKVTYSMKLGERRIDFFRKCTTQQQIE